MNATARTVRQLVEAPASLLYFVGVSLAQAADERHGERSALEQLRAYDPMYFILGDAFWQVRCSLILHRNRS